MTRDLGLRMRELIMFRDGFHSDVGNKYTDKLQGQLRRPPTGRLSEEMSFVSCQLLSTFAFSLRASRFTRLWVYRVNLSRWIRLTSRSNMSKFQSLLSSTQYQDTSCHGQTLSLAQCSALPNPNLESSVRQLPRFYYKSRMKALASYERVFGCTLEKASA